MNETKFTPGPWSEEAAHLTNDQLDINDDYRRIECGEKFYSGDRKTGFSLTGFIRPEDARLIVAAPEMYEAMKEFCDRVDKGEVRSVKTYAKFKEILKRVEDELKN